jgi:hypothetical protein
MAIREPTEAMTGCATATLETDDALGTTIVWQAMIDAILAERTK